MNVELYMWQHIHCPSAPSKKPNKQKTQQNPPNVDVPWICLRKGRFSTFTCM